MISFVVLNWNSGGFLRRCFASIERQTDRRFELIVVDNGSRNESLDTIAEFQARGVISTLVALEDNVGFAAGMNAGIARASGDWIVPLNSDACVADNLVAELHAFAPPADAGPPAAGMISVPIYQWDYGADVDRLTSTLHTAGVTLVRRLAVSAWHPAIDSPEELVAPSGVAPILSRAAVRAAEAYAGHVFDPVYFAYAEDIDLFIRLNALGFHCVSCLRSSIWHIGSASSGQKVQLQAKPFRLQVLAQVNRWRTFAKIGAAGNRARLLPWMLFDDLCRLVIGPRRLKLAAAYLRNYAVVWQRSIRYPDRRVAFAGALYSRSGWHLLRRGTLPPLPGAESERATQDAERPDPDVLRVPSRA